MSVENYHSFINKTQSIAGQDRGIHDVFLQNEKTSQYAWNSTPINGTYIIRSVADVSREFRFLLDAEIFQPPTTLNRATLVCMSIFGKSRITLSLKRKSSRFLSKSDGPRIENSETKIYPPSNLNSDIQLNHTPK